MRQEKRTNMHIKPLLCIDGQTPTHINQHGSIEVIRTRIYISHQPRPLHLLIRIIMFWAMRGILTHFMNSEFLWRDQPFSPQQLEAILAPLLASWGLSRLQFSYPWSPSVCTLLLPFLSPAVPACLPPTPLIENWTLAETDEQVLASNITSISVLLPVNIKFALCGFPVT